MNRACGRGTTGNTMGTGSTDPNVIAVGASTSERVYAQTGTYGFPLSNGKYTSDQVSGLSSGGISQTNRVMDLLAPGDLNWTLCSDRLLNGQPQYQACSDYNGRPSNLAVEGGTSESSPLTAGAAALVIQAYGRGQSDASPSLVSALLDSSADDLGLPADEQGAGLLNTYRATTVARNYRISGASGTEMVGSQTQIGDIGTPGQHITNTVRLTNWSAAGSHPMVAPAGTTAFLSRMAFRMQAMTGRPGQGGQASAAGARIPGTSCWHGEQARPGSAPDHLAAGPVGDADRAFRT